jgi:diguanylate cyclase (GGDEF)-like protein/PAS domain S-box-containing protein
MSLYARIAALLIGFVSISVLAISWFSYRTQVDDFLRQREANAQTLTAAVARSIFSDTLEGRHTKVRSTLRAIAQTSPEIRYILLIGFDGQPFASTFPDEPPQALMKLHDDGQRQYRHRQFLLGDLEIDDFSHPLIENLDAHLHVGYDSTAFRAALDDTRRKIFWLTLGVIGLALLAAALAAQRIALPLQQLAVALRGYGDGQRFDPEKIDHSGPEVSQLVDSFAAMAAQRESAEENLRIAATAFETQEAIIITDAQSRIIRVNHAFTKITGYPAQEVIGATPAILKSGRHDRVFYERMWEALQKNGAWSGEIWDRRHDGEIYPKRLTITAVQDVAGRITHYIGNFIDISEQKRIEAHIQHLAYHDALTGLLNRLSLHERMEQVIALARRDRQRFALMLIDLDRFKEVNDTLGHHIGDQLLIQVGQRLLESVRDSDIVARLGGDEFIVVLNAIETPDTATHLAGKIVATLSEPFYIDGKVLDSSPSIGICLFPDEAETLGELIQNADVAMYEAKAQGRCRHVSFTPQMKVAVTRRMEIERKP